MHSHANSFHSEPVLPTRTVTRAFCPNGHNLLDVCSTINDMAGVKFAFIDARGERGLLVLSPTLGCFDKLVLEGRLVEEEKIQLACPECGAGLDVLGPCDCRPATAAVRGDLCMIYLTEEHSPEEAIVICNLVGCHNSSIRHAGEYIQA
jgi:hypothetical protein